MKIRKMAFADLPEVLGLSSQLGYPITLQELEHNFRPIMDNDEYALLVAEVDNHVVGWLQVNAEMKTLIMGCRSEISALVVDETHRGLGIGKKLVKAAEDWAVERKLKLMRVRSNIKRERAHKFYEREGYVLLKTGHTFIKNLWE